jgi:tripartite-type tricarboxylate transporter receptor subunit TctC
MLTTKMLLPISIALVAILTAPAASSPFPSKTIKLISAGPAGGPADLAARMIAPRLQSSLLQNVVVENRPGTPRISAQEMAAAEPDGHTLLLANTSVLATFPAVSAKRHYDPTKAFVLVAGVSQAHQILVVHPSVPAKTVGELVTYAKQNPGKLNYAAGGGVGALPHLAGELFKARSGVDIAPVFYKGSADAVTAVLGGQVQMTFENVTVLLPLIAAGKVTALAVTGARRSPQAPTLPTMEEAGVADCIASSFFGVVAPAATPASVVDRINGAINDILKSDDMQQAFAKLGAETMPGTSPDFATFVASEINKWSAVAKAAGVMIE